LTHIAVVISPGAGIFTGIGFETPGSHPVAIQTEFEKNGFSSDIHFSFKEFST
jgi:hypothetical protein